MASLKVWVSNNKVYFQQSGDPFPLGRSDVEDRYTDNEVLFYHKDKGYLDDFENEQQKFLFSEIQDQAGTPVGNTISDIQTYFEDKIGNFRNPAGTGSTSPAGSTGDVQINLNGSDFGAIPSSGLNYDITQGVLNTDVPVSINKTDPILFLITYGFESGDLTGFTTSGDAGWTVDSINPSSGVYSARSGVITHNQKSILELSHTSITPRNKIFFDFYTSSESNFDFLEFYINDEIVGVYSGVNAWNTVSFYIDSGTNTFKWTYVKDGGASSGEDLVRVDNIRFSDIKPDFASNGTSVFEGETVFKNNVRFIDPINGLVKIGQGILIENDSNPIYIGDRIGFASLFFGRNSGQNVTSGTNIGIGRNACQNLIGGTRNISIGDRTLQNSTGAESNVCVGYLSLRNCTGTGNTAFGDGALAGVTTGSHNIGIGRLSGASTTGSNNIFIGNFATGYGLLTGSGNIIMDSGSAITNIGDMSNNVRIYRNNILVFKINELNEHTIPLQTIATINSGGDKSIITKEYLDDAITNSQGSYTTQQYFSETTLTSGANISWDLEINQTTAVTLTQNSTLDNPTNMVAGGTYVIRIVQGGTGSYTLNFGTAFVSKDDSTIAYTKTISTSVGSYTTIAFYCDGTKMIA